jgi:hypothetical protein
MATLTKTSKISKGQSNHPRLSLFTQYERQFGHAWDDYALVHDEDFISMEVDDECVKGQHKVAVEVEDMEATDKKFVESAYMTCLDIAQVLRLGDCSRHRKSKRLCDHTEYEESQQCRKRRKMNAEEKCPIQTAQAVPSPQLTSGERHCLQVEEDAMLNETFCPHFSDRVQVFKKRVSEAEQEERVERNTAQQCGMCKK